VAASSDQPIPFATIGVKGKPVGSTADETGRFAFAAPASLATSDSVVISCVGYRSRGLTVAQLQQADRVWQLEPLTQNIEEVQVRHAKLKPGILGSKITISPLQWTTEKEDGVDDERGWEMATVVPVRHESYVDGFHLYIAHNEFNNLRLRFTLYDVQKGRPTHLLLTDDIQLNVGDQRTGWFELDLRKYNIHLVKGQTVAAGVQWLQGEKATAKSWRLSGPILMPSVINRTLIRQKSEAPWEKYVANVCMYLAVQQDREK
jgi:hypothetical protein